MAIIADATDLLLKRGDWIAILCVGAALAIPVIIVLWRSLNAQMGAARDLKNVVDANTNSNFRMADQMQALMHAIHKSAELNSESNKRLADLLSKELERRPRR